MPDKIIKSSSSPKEIVKRFIGCFNSGAVDEAMALLSEDVFYHNVPMTPMKGREAVRTFTAEFGIGTKWCADWEIVNLAENGEMVLTERVDVFRLADGRSINVPLMGSFRVRDGLIAEWRDYFDLADFEQQLGSLIDAPDENLASSENE